LELWLLFAPLREVRMSLYTEARSWKLLHAGMALPLAVLAVLLWFAAPAQATFPGANGKIVVQNRHWELSADGAGGFEFGPSYYTLFMINPGGTGRTLLADDNAGRGRWSPDGQQLAFQSGLLVGCCYAEPPIEVINADGSGRTLVTNRPGRDEESGTNNLGGWSPDGSRIAFTSYRKEVTPQEVFTIRPDASERTQVTHGGVLPCIFCSLRDPAWSSDGQIAFAYRSSESSGIAIVNADGTGERILTSAAAGDFDPRSPVWSPDGKTIAFLEGFFGSQQVHTVNADGSAEAQLTYLPYSPSEFIDETLSWSPDGRKLLWGRGSDVYTLDPDGGAIVNLTNDGRSAAPVWSPDSRKIAFSVGYPTPAADDTADGVYVMNRDGSGRTQVTSSPQGFDLPTDWQALPFKNASKKCSALPGDYRNHGQCVKANR
jgi:Tol biopolymer transport system component